ncbi:MAG TPA: hypothetical protein VGQ85_04890 [Candidatus Limnocylindrales bacterium]|nr:hypothetical protein [Candidatus Limnocylindrales bacterium]
MKRAAFLISVVSLLSLGLAAPALASTPGNDTYATRQVIASLPFSDKIDTTVATTDADDTAVSALCGAPPTDASVWYEYTPAADGGVIVDFTADYSAGVIVVSGSPGSYTLEGCSGGPFGFSGVSGVTYTILVFDYQADGGGNGGSLQINVSAAPPPPVIHLTVNPSGSFNPKTGSATIRGTITCSGGTGGKDILDVQLTQTVGRFKFSAEAAVQIPECDGAAHAWTAGLLSPGGKFGGGKASVSVFALTCGLFDCASDTVNRTVTLKK